VQDESPPQADEEGQLPDSVNPFNPAVSRLLTLNISEASFTSAPRQPGKLVIPSVFSPQNHCLPTPDGVCDRNRRSFR